MTRRYPGELTRRRTAATGLASAASLAVLLALGSWLAPPLAAPPEAGGQEASEDGMGASSTPPGAVTCPPSRQDAPEAPGSALLVDCPAVFDGHTVTYTGEAIEAVVRRRGRSVVVLNDDGYADAGPLPATGIGRGGNSGLAVVLPVGSDGLIQVLGSARAHGDVVAVTGTFDAASGLLGGEPAVLAEAARVQRRGRPIEQPVPSRLVAAAAVAAAAAAAAAAANRRGRRA